MIRNIILSYIFLCLLFALSLALLGVDSHMFGQEFRAFLSTTSYDMRVLHFIIPYIPSIPVDEVVTLSADGNNILEVFINFAKGFFTFINYLIVVINFLVRIVNYVIQLLEFIFILFRNILIMRDSIAA